MKWTPQQLAFILYNNRSVEGVVQNFLPHIDGFQMIELEKKLDWCKGFYQQNQRFLEIESSRLDLTSDDVIFTKQELEDLSQIVLDSHINLSGIELEYLLNRGITKDIIDKYKIGGLSFIKDLKHLEILNATCHPILKPILEDGIEGGGIIIPLWNGDVLENCAIRKLSDIGKLKYSLACPDLPVWGLDSFNSGEDVWICEGLFDMMALHNLGFRAVSVSSAMWSGPQLWSLLQKKPGFIHILCDKDQVGLKTGLILSKFFNISGIPNHTCICNSGKDAAEILFEKKLDMDDIDIIHITKEMIEKQDDSFNFLKYLENRRF